MNLKSIKLNLTHYLGFLAVLLFAFSTRLYFLGKPSELVFDERYHVPAVKLIAEKDPRAFEWWHDPAVGGRNIYGSNNHDWLHPPLAKYIQASFWFPELKSENLFFNLRFPAVIFGVTGIVLVFYLAQFLFKDFKLSLLASLILSLDGLWLVQSRLVTNDIFVSVFILGVVLSFVWYLRERRLSYLLVVGLMIGLSLATKWSAFWIWLAVWSYLLVDLVKDKRKTNKQKLSRVPWLFFSLGLVPVGIYFLSYLPIFMAGGLTKGWQYFTQLHKNILWYQFGRNSFHAYASKPGDWFLNLRPVWYWTQNLGAKRADIYALGNPVISLLGAGAVLGILISWREKISKSLQVSQSLPLIFYFYLASFLPWVFSPRILFYYHYTPAIPFLSILLAWWVLHKHQRLMVVALITLMAFGFWLFYPHWMGFPVPKEFAEAVYFALPSWR